MALSNSANDFSEKAASQMLQDAEEFLKAARELTKSTQKLIEQFFSHETEGQHFRFRVG